MMWLLDTNVLSELRPGKSHASPAVRQWAASVPIGRQFISAITLAELETGILRLEHLSPRKGRPCAAGMKASSPSSGNVPWSSILRRPTTTHVCRHTGLDPSTIHGLLQSPWHTA